VTNVFTAAEQRDLLGDPHAFIPGPRTPKHAALQNHLALEVISFLHAESVPFTFKGGTALHARLGARIRFSVDVDISTREPERVHAALRKFVARFPSVALVEPSKPLLEDGVRHVLRFNNPFTHGDLWLLVEVMPEAPGVATDPVALSGDGYAWPGKVHVPTFEEFAGQKLAVLGPRTVGKPVGLNDQFARQNQGVAKQIFDLRELLRLDLEGKNVLAAYSREVDHCVKLRRLRVQLPAACEDALALLTNLRGPPTNDKSNPLRYGLWQGHLEANRWIAAGARFDATDYRVVGGSLARVFTQMADGALDWEAAGRPCRSEGLPADVRERINRADAAREAWILPEFGGLQRVVWGLGAPRLLVTHAPVAG
jgi:hypothetical protein